MVISVRHCAKRVKSAERTKLTKQIKRTKRKQGEDNENRQRQTAYRSERQRTHVGTNLRANGNQRAVRIIIERREYHFAMATIASSPATGRIVGEPVIRDNPFVGAGNVHDVVVTGGIQLARRVLFEQHARFAPGPMQRFGRRVLDAVFRLPGVVFRPAGVADTVALVNPDGSAEDPSSYPAFVDIRMSCHAAACQPRAPSSATHWFPASPLSVRQTGNTEAGDAPSCSAQYERLSPMQYSFEIKHACRSAPFT